MRILLGLAAVLTTVACTPIPPLPGQTATPSITPVSASGPSTLSEPSPSPDPSPEPVEGPTRAEARPQGEQSPAGSHPSAGSGSPSAGSGSPSAGSGPSTGSGSPSTGSGSVGLLRYGETARLAYFDVTALRQEHGQDGVSIGWKVRVCYRAPHPGAGSDGRTRVSNNPWSVEFRDGETGGPTQWRAIQVLPHDPGWVPEYTETRLALGECHEGWMAVRHENPDLQWTGLRYAPADFGDTVVWR